MIMLFIKWYLRGRIEYLKRSATNAAITDSEIRRDGCSEDWWIGKAVGIETALTILFGLDRKLDK